MTKIFGHRGYKGKYPENTILSFKKAIELEIDGIELDVHLSKDKELIVIHDETVNRTTDGTGYIKDLTLYELKKLDAGSWFDENFKGEKIPTLDEVLDLLIMLNFKGILNIEIKTDKIKYREIEKILANKIKSRNLNFECIYSSFNIKSLIKINKYDKENKKTFLTKKLDIKNSILKIINKNEKFVGLNPSIKYFKKGGYILNDFHKDINVWTVNTANNMELCFEKNISAIFTDYPELAINLRNEYENKDI